MKELYSSQMLRQIVNEAIENTKNEFQPVFGKDVEKDNKKINADSYKETEDRTKAVEGPVGGIDVNEETNTKAQDDFERSSKGNDRLKYDLPLSDKTKERIEKYMTGKTNKEVAPGESIKGNEKFVNKSKKLNKWDIDNPGHNTSVDQIAPIEKLANLKKDSFVKENKMINEAEEIIIKGNFGYGWEDVDAYDSNDYKRANANFKEYLKSGDGGQYKMVRRRIKKPQPQPVGRNETKFKKGDTIKETKTNKRLKLIGVKENKVQLLETKTNKKFFITKENFKKGLKEGKLLKEGGWVLDPQDIEFIGQIDPNQKIFWIKIWSGSGYMLLPTVVSADNVYKALYKIGTEWEKNGDPRLVSQEEYNRVQNEEGDEVAEEMYISDDNGHFFLEENFSVNEITPEKLTELAGDLVPWANKQPQQENIKRLHFKRRTFLSEQYMFDLIPEDYKKDGKKFFMKDKDENEFLIEWSTDENKPFILEHRNKKMVKESINKFHHLSNYKSSDYLKKITPETRMNETDLLKNQILENKGFTTKEVINENVDENTFVKKQMSGMFDLMNRMNNL